VRVAFGGTPEFARAALAAIVAAGFEVPLVLTQPDRPAGRGRKLQSGPVKALALELGIPVHQPERLKDPATHQPLIATAPDVLVIAAYGLILPQAVLDIPRLGCLNIHASLLPRWRGAAPIQRAILAGDAETGITVMQMDEGLDTGDMLLKSKCAITAEDTAETLHDKLAAIGAQAIVEALRKLESGTLPPEKQDGALATYAAKLSKSEAQLDWKLDAAQLERAVRGYFPFPVASTVLGETPIKILRAQAADAHQAEPGTVIAADKNGIIVACGRGALGLGVLQKPGGKPLPAAQFLQSFPIKAGDRFGTN
jgi:methionyl-tRNA formyltransferase